MPNLTDKIAVLANVIHLLTCFTNLLWFPILSPTAFAKACPPYGSLKYDFITLSMNYKSHLIRAN